MLNEPSFVPQKVGWIEVICDGMFSGKTEELIRRAKRAGQYVTKLHAVCAKSGAMAHYSQRVVKSRDRVLVGEAEAYEPRARHRYRPPVDKRHGKSITSIKKQESAETEEDNEQ